jgi:hypothetical protein
MKFLNEIYSVNFHMGGGGLGHTTSGPISEWSKYFEYLYGIFNRYNI